jgi:uncharacterized protein YdbL (DUF1318 family)
MMKKFLFVIVSIVFTNMAFVAQAQADLAAMKARVPALVKAKEAGIVGEQQDGLVGLIDASKADEEVKKLVAAENADRMKIYRERASEQSQELGVFMKVMGEARIEAEKAGRFVQSSDGSWKKK